MAVAVATGFAAGGAAYGVERLLTEVLTGSKVALVLLPAIGLVANALARAVRHTGPASVDAYIDAFHGGPIDDADLAARSVGSVATVGLGGALDPAGLAVMIGTLIGGWGRRLTKGTGPRLLVVGAAAAFGAALHAPVCGAVLAIEIPYREGASWRRFPAALFGSVVGFLARGILDDFELPFRTDIGVVGLRDVLLGIWLAVLAGFAARVVAWVTNRAQSGLGPKFAREWQHVLVGATVVAGLAALSLAAFDDVPVSLGSGQAALGWAATASIAGMWALVAVRGLAVGATMLGRGTGGLFIPLLVIGLIAGHAVGDMFDGNLGLLAIIGAATLLGAGYRVPVAALVWLAESTHSLPAVALGAVAVLIAASVGGGRSVSTAQRHQSPVRSSAP